MPVNRLGKAEQGLEEPLDRRGREQVAAPHDVGHLLEGVIHDDGQMVGDADVLARQDDVARQGRVHLDSAVFTSGPGAGLGKGEETREPTGLPDVQSPGEGFAVGEALALLGRGKAVAEVGGFGPMGCLGHGFRHLPARPEAPVGETLRYKTVQGFAVGGPAVRLKEAGQFPVDPQPGQVLNDGAFEFRTAPGPVDVLDPEAKPPARSLRRTPCRQG